MGDIGDGDPDHEAAGVLGVGVRFGIDRIVAVAGVGRVDGDESDIAQVAAFAHRDRDGGVRLGNCGVGELVGDAVLVDGDQRHGAGAGGVAKARGDANGGQTEAGFADTFSLDQFAVFCAARGIAGDAPFLVLPLLVDGDDAPAFRAFAENPQHLEGIRAKPADQPGFVGVVLAFDLCQAGEDAVPRTKGGIALLRQDQDAGAGRFNPGFQRDREKIALGIGRKDGQHRHGRQGAGRVVLAAGAFFKCAFVFQFGEHALEVDARIALDAKGLGDVTFGGRAGIFRDPLADLVFGRQVIHVIFLACLAVARKHGWVKGSENRLMDLPVAGPSVLWLEAQAGGQGVLARTVPLAIRARLPGQAR